MRCSAYRHFRVASRAAHNALRTLGESSFDMMFFENRDVCVQPPIRFYGRRERTSSTTATTDHASNFTRARHQVMRKRHSCQIPRALRCAQERFFSLYVFMTVFFETTSACTCIDCTETWGDCPAHSLYLFERLQRLRRLRAI
jgi:hypothetical protein